MIEFIDHRAGAGKQGRYKLTKQDGASENVTLELDDDAEVDGTPLNRENMMAIQGFEAKRTVFNADGSITETNSKDETLTTTFPDENTVIETFVGEKTITKTTKFNDDGSITEVLS